MVSDIYLAPYFVVVPREINKQKQMGFGVKKAKPAHIRIKADSPFEFDEDKSPIVIYDWEGDFKKGTFTLSPVTVFAKYGKFKGGLYSEYLIAVKNGKLGNFYSYNRDLTRYDTQIKFEGSDAEWNGMRFCKRIEANKIIKVQR